MSSRGRWFGCAKDVLLGIAALLGAVCILVAVLAPLAGVRPLIVRSGSMEPAYPTGSLVMTRTVDAARVGHGDVVAVERGATLVMHRVIDVTSVAGTDRVLLQLKGDANAAADPERDDVSEVLLVVAHVPHAGAVVAWLARPPGVFVLGAYLAVCTWFLVRPQAGPEPEDG